MATKKKQALPINTRTMAGGLQIRQRPLRVFGTQEQVRGHDSQDKKAARADEKRLHLLFDKTKCPPMVTGIHS